MTDWTAGYLADIGYTYGYYTELNPLRLKLAFLKAGLADQRGQAQIKGARHNKIQLLP